MMGKPTKSITIKVCQVLPIIVFLSLFNQINFNQNQFLAARAALYRHMGWTE